jgi:type I restriction enzyme M protein
MVDESLDYLRDVRERPTWQPMPPDVRAAIGDEPLPRTGLGDEAAYEDFLSLVKKRAESEKSWTVSVDSVDQSSFDLSVKNPNVVEVVDQRTPAEILDEIERLDRESAEILARLRSLL